MDPSDHHPCAHCGRPMEVGAISWSGDPIFWNSGERRDRRQHRAEELILGPFSRQSHPEAAGLRCPSCRTVVLRY